MKMRPTLRQLEYIVTVARLGRFGLAAEALHVSQPSLSAQIAQAEAELGLRLFQRNRAGVAPTAQGNEVIRRAQKILREVEDLRALSRGDTPFGGRLRLGVLPSIGPYLLPRVVSSMHQSLPELRLVLREENTQNLEQGLKSGRLDMIISTPEDHPNTLQHHLFTETLWVAVARDDPLANHSGPVGAGQLRGRIFLTLDRGHRLSRIVYALSSQCGGTVSDEYEGTSLDSIRLMAASGAGVAILPELYARQQAGTQAEVAILPLDVANSSRDIALIQPSHDTAATGSLLVAQALRDAAAALGFETLPARSTGECPPAP